MLRYLTAGESHGKALIAILEGMVANLPLSAEDINKELLRRQGGLGRGGRMKIEKDKAEIISGVRNGRTIGSPISVVIKNLDWENWEDVMTVESGDKVGAEVTQLRPGHADLAGVLKYGQTDIRNVLERASARETAARVAAGAVARKFLDEFKIIVGSRVLQIGKATTEKGMKEEVENAGADGDSLGGIFEVTVKNCPPGLGSHVHWDRKLKARLAAAVMSINAVKGVEIGLGFASAALRGSQVHDEILFSNGKFAHRTNNAGGLEGGMTNGEEVVLRAALKPIATLKKPLRSVDLKTKKPIEAHVERADVCAVEAAGVIGEAVVAMEIANAMLEKFGGDSVKETSTSFKSYMAKISG